MSVPLRVGVLALQGGVIEHITALQKAAVSLAAAVDVVEVRTPEQLATCDALVIPGGESTTLSLVAAQSGLLEPLRDFVKVRRKPTWGTCAGLILLSEEASSAKKGGQELIGGLDVRVHRNHFGRQRESFITDLPLAFLAATGNDAPFPAVFIRAPVVDKLLTDRVENLAREANVAAPGGGGGGGSSSSRVEVLATLAGRHASNKAAAGGSLGPVDPEGAGDIVALRQGNVFGTSFHPELTDDSRIHVWWLQQLQQQLQQQHQQQRQQQQQQKQQQLAAPPDGR